MRYQRVLRWSAVAAGSAVLFQCGACCGNEFWIRLAGAGAIVSGFVNLFTGT
ncbi:MAG TPA: hypothetical protein PLQ89_06770 [Phycisphaerae bacterium]|nr:hypothetical protein [Phycisphaerae bacterium]HPP27893.1 hypothetical protein [Phycisphaerae bacterium]